MRHSIRRAHRKKRYVTEAALLNTRFDILGFRLDAMFLLIYFLPHGDEQVTLTEGVLRNW